MPLIFDYEWLLDGRLFFYLVDSNSGGESSVVSCLLIRAFFNDFIRDQNISLNTLPSMLESIEKGMATIDNAQPMSAIFGYVDLADEALFILSAGLDAVWENKRDRHILHASEQLVLNAAKNKVHRFPIMQRNTLLLNNLGCSSFKLELSFTSVD